MQLYERPDEMVPAQVRERLALPPVGQVGYVVEDVRAVIAQFRDKPRMTRWLVLDHDHSRTFNGAKGRCTLRIALAYQGEMQLELIQVMDGDTIHAGAATQQAHKVHHLGFNVRNLDRRLAHCQGNGAPVLQQGTIKSAGLTVDYAYVDASHIGGPDVLLELIQWRIGPLPVPVNRLIFNASCVLGAWTVYRGKIVR